MMTGSTPYAAGILTFIFMIIFSVVRFIFGYCGGFKSQTTEPVNEYQKFAHYGWGALALAIFLIGGTCAFVGAQIYRNELWDTTDTLRG